MEQNTLQGGCRDASKGTMGSLAPELFSYNITRISAIFKITAMETKIAEIIRFKPRDFTGDFLIYHREERDGPEITALAITTDSDRARIKTVFKSISQTLDETY